MSKKESALKMIGVMLDEVEQGQYMTEEFDGHKSKWGLTETFVNLNFPDFKGEIRDISRNEALRMYYMHFFVRGSAGKIIHISESIAEEWFDQAVNTGRRGSTKRLQSCLNSNNIDRSGQQRLTEDLEVDGQYGNKTHNLMYTLLNYYKEDMESVLLKQLDSYQSFYYTSLGVKNRKYRKHIRGWHNKRIH